MLKVLHVTAHVGGGIGSALAGITTPDKEFSHDILLLEAVEKPDLLRKFYKNGCRIYSADDSVPKLFESADIVQLHWWHHPALYRLMNVFPKVPIRSSIWIHVSGCTYPYVRSDFISKFMRIIFACAKTYENPEVKTLSQDVLDRIHMVYGLGDISPFLNVSRNTHRDFVVGYAGTLSYSKIHPKFHEFCAAAKHIKNIRFVIVGDMANSKIIETKLKDCGVNNVEFWGYCNDMRKVFAEFDVFGYLLNPYHFGATENIILEAMASGLPVVALNQSVEKYIVEDSITGLLINNPEEYGSAIEFLSRETQTRNSMSDQARKSAMHRFGIKENKAKLYDVYRSMMTQDKEKLDLMDVVPRIPSEAFLYFVENELDIFRNENGFSRLPHIFWEKTKSSVFHYAHNFPNDKKLNNWAQNMLENPMK